MDYCINSRVCKYGKRAVIELLWAIIKHFIFHILDLNENEWVPVQGCILEIWTYGPFGINTTSVETPDGLRLYCYTGCMLGIAPLTKKTLPDFFVEIWIPINGTQPCGIG